MSPITQLVGFGLRQVIGDYADGAVQVAAVIEQRFRDHSRTLPKALDHAHHRAWQALGVALAGDGLLDRVKVFFASGDDKGVREQVQLFLDGNAVSFDGTPADFRRDCLDELQRLRKSGRLSTSEGAHAAIARQAAGFQRHADPQGLVEEARRAVNGVADALAENYPNLAGLLRTPTLAGPPLLAAAFCYFFRREVETNDELAHGLFFDGLRQLSASQAKAFDEVGQALASLGGQFDALFEQLGRIEAAVEETHAVAVETHGAVLDIQTELQRSHGEARTLMEQVLLRLGQVGMARGEVQPGNSCLIRGEDERRAVKALLVRFRQLPAEEQRQAPALLNGLGKLQHGAGNHAEARQTFTEVVQVVGNPTDKAEASFNAYRAALEEKKWDAALTALREAGSHDPQRFAPFPLHRYEPTRILGAGGFGTAILCHDRNFDEDVVVKTLHTADLARGVDDVFREARILRQLSHPAIIGLRDCEYADPAHKARPYLVMDHFPGGTLQEFVEERGPLGLEQVLTMAVQVAEGMIAAHAKGVLHRDLKPANLLVREEGNVWTVKIIDFGLALRQQTVETSQVRTGATQQGMMDWSVAGTLDYAPPEQLGKLPGVQPGPYSDVYAFGKTCWYAMFKATEQQRKQWPSLPGPLADLLEGCLDPDPKQRPSGFEPVLAALGECSRRGQEAGRREQEERLHREQKEEQRRQKEGEEQLHQLVRAALDRTGGKPTPADTAEANELRRRHRIPREQAKAIIRQVWEQWQKERPREVQPGMILAASQGFSTVELTVPGNWHARPVDMPLAELTWVQEGSGVTDRPRSRN
jgi:tetratricopeptide (TPR) repeat protein